MPISKAQQIYQQVSKEFPVDPAAIAKRLGIIVKRRPYDSKMDKDFCGSAYIKNNTRIIEYNSSNHPLRIRFTIAHELGHHALGHVRKEKKIQDTYKELSFSSDPQEVAANAFAAELLMPEKIMRHAVFEKGISDRDKLCELFNVSKPAMAKRMEKLGLYRAI